MLTDEGAVRGIACGLMADHVIELGLRALRTQKSTQVIRNGIRR